MAMTHLWTWEGDEIRAVALGTSNSSSFTPSETRREFLNFWNNVLEGPCSYDRERAAHEPEANDRLKRDDPAAYEAKMRAQLPTSK
jgi:hypothetical protein